MAGEVVRELESGPEERRPTISIAPTGLVALRSDRAKPASDPRDSTASPATEDAPSGEARPGARASTRTVAFVVAGIVATALSLQGIRALRAGTESTDNALLAARSVSVSTETAGIVREVAVREHERVEAGAVLMRLDTTSIDIRIARARGELAAAEAAFDQANMRSSVTDKQVDAHVTAARGDELTAQARQKSIKAQSLQAEAAVQAAQAMLDHARRELESAEHLHKTRSLADAQLEESRSKAASAEAELRRAKAAHASTLAEQAAADGARRAASGKVQFSLSGAEAKLAEADVRLAAARVDEAKAALALAELEKKSATVVAPASGIIEKRRVEPGSYVTPGGEQFLLVASDRLWVEANFKESQIGALAVGQTAKIELDAFPDLMLEGRVESIGGATLSRTAVLQSGAAGMGFARAAQRVPVTIAIDQPPNVALPTGLNATVSVRVKKP